MPRLLSVSFNCVVAICLVGCSWATAQEPNSNSEEPSAAQPGSSYEFELPGIDFPLGAKIVVKHMEGSDEHITAGGSIEIECECLKNQGVPFLSNIPHVNKLFTNVGLASCTKIKMDESEGGCSSKVGDTCPAASSSCKSESECKPCASCTVTKIGVPIQGHDRLFTAIEAISKPCDSCTATSQCETCDGCPAACPAKKTQSNQPSKRQIAKGAVELVGYFPKSPNPTSSPAVSSEEVFELRLENERLKMGVESAECRLEMMEAIMEIREENAVLRTKLEFFQAHHHSTKSTDAAADNR